MTGLPDRGARTGSKLEEENVTAFVDATVNFVTNCDFTGPFAAGTAFTGSHILFLAQGGAATANAAFAALAGSYYTADVQSALEGDAAEGKAYAVGTVNGKRVLVGLVATQASRHNCAARPDSITSIVTEALGDGKRVTGLDVVSAFGPAFDLAVTQAVAKASHSFSAKANLWQKGYAKELTKVTTHFAHAVDAARAADLRAVAESVQICARLVDAPTNLLDTITYPQICQGFAKRFGGAFTVTVLAGEELREAGYGGLYGVGKAAEFPAALVTMSYKPANATKEKIALVGKGMVYDCGGLSIKTPTPNMCSMKCDMGGSAAVFTGFLAAVRLQSAHPIDCVLCLADNAISARAQRNDDIVIMKSGRTIQINNTDAEGRLILGDGVFHAAALCGEEPSVVVTMATLTGAQGIATGVHHAGLYASTEEWENAFLASGRKSGDLVFPFVYAPEFHAPEFACKNSDNKNLMARTNNAGSACAGWFIESNLPKTYKGKFVHVDLASPAFQADLGTGYGPSLIVQLVAAQFQ